jgi:hypothetical protein
MGATAVALEPTPFGRASNSKKDGKTLEDWVTLVVS